MDIGDIVAMLADRVEVLVAELLPHGTREGHEWRVGSVAGEPGRSMAVHLRPPRAGIWCDWGAGEDMRGDALDLVAQVRCGGDKARAVHWSRAWLGLENADPARMERQRRQAATRHAAADRDEQRRRGQAFRLFLDAQASLAGTPAERYLAARGIRLARLGRQPRALRYHPSLWNEETQRDWPALVAAIVNADGGLVAVHRTWLLPDGSGKAALRNPKMTLGRYGGGAIRLCAARAASRSVRRRPEIPSLFPRGSRTA